MNKNDKIYVAGHRGMVGSSLTRKLKTEGFERLLLRTSAELDLRKQDDVHDFFKTEQPDIVFLAAARVGGIMANQKYRAEFLYDNLMIQSNVIHAAYQYEVKKLMFLGSSCIYPKFAPQPLKEESLLTGQLEPSNEPYAIAKIAGIKLCEAYQSEYGCNFIAVMPTNLYGPNDNYDLNTSHVLPAMIRKFHDAKINHQPSVMIWGTGTPRREFLHADDLAEACLLIMEQYNGPGFLNIGTGEDLEIKELALLIKKIVGYSGKIEYDLSKPDGTPRKLMDITRISQLGWKARIGLEEGIQNVYSDFAKSGPVAE